MALRDAQLAIRFAGGVETKEDEKHVAITKLLACEDGVFTRNGTVATRYGYNEVSRERIDTSGKIPAAKASGKRASELIAFSEDEAFSFATGAGGWKKAGDMVSPTLNHRAVAKRPIEQIHGDCAENGGVAAYTWQEAGGVYTAVYDATTERNLLAPVLLDAAGENPRAVNIGNQIAILYIVAAQKRIWITVINPDEPSATLVPSILTDNINATYQAFDVSLGQGGERTLISWYSDTDKLRIGFIHQSGVLGSPVTGLPSVVEWTATVAGAIACSLNSAPDVGTWAVAYYTGADLRRVRGNSILSIPDDDLVVAGTTDLKRLTVVWEPETNISWIAWDEDDAGARVTHWISTHPSDPFGTEQTIRSSKVASKAFHDAERGYFIVVHESTLFTMYFLLRDDGLICARLLPGNAGTAPTVDSLPAVQVGTDARVKSVVVNYRVRLDAVNEDEFTESGLRRIELDFDAADSHQNCQLGLSTYVAGAGMLWEYDGLGFVEQGIHYAPDDVAAPTQGAAAGDGVDVGTHLYRFAWGWVNEQGELEWGPVSAGTEVVVGGSPMKVTFAVPTMPHTLKTAPRAELFLGVFRSEAGIESVLHMVSSPDPAATGINGYVTNDPTAATVSFDDEMSDATLQTKERLYTNGGVLSNDPTPSGKVLACARDRLFFSDPTDENLIHVGQERRELYSAEVSPTLQIRLDPFGGAVTALIELDGQIVAFKERAIYLAPGQGPTPTGDSGFAAPVRVNTDVGCKDQRTLARLPIGLMFFSEKGWRLIDRSLQVHYIGAPVEKYTDPERENQTFVDATVLPDRNEVRCLTSAGISLYYSYEFNRWSEVSNHEGVTAELVDNVYHYIRTDGDVYSESLGAFADVQKAINLAVETANIKLAQHLQGFSRIHTITVIGNFVGVHTLRVRAAYDYEKGWTDDITVDPSLWTKTPVYGDGDYGAGPYGGDHDTRYQCEIHIDEECEAVRFRLEAVQASGAADATFEISEILVHGGIAAPKYVLAPERMS